MKSGRPAATQASMSGSYMTMSEVQTGPSSGRSFSRWPGSVCIARIATTSPAAARCATSSASPGSSARMPPGTAGGVTIETTAKRSGAWARAHRPQSSSMGNRTALSTPTASM